MTYIGMFVGGPLLAKTFSWGMKLGSIRTGIAFPRRCELVLARYYCCFCGPAELL